MVVLAAGTVSYIKGNAEVNRRERVVSGGEYCSTGCAEQEITRTEKIAEMKKKSTP